MHDARGVANFFLDRAERNRLDLTIMTLLKVLYFSHAWHLAKHGEPLVAQPFEAWKYGPVNRVVYDQFKDYRSRPLDRKLRSFDPKKLSFSETIYCFDARTEGFLENIFDYYCKFHPFRLSDLTHEAGGPWDTIWQEASRRAVPGMVIPNDLIASWFRGHRALYWTDRERGLPS